MVQAVLFLVLGRALAEACGVGVVPPDGGPEVAMVGGSF